jgi:hypothetical protein
MQHMSKSKPNQDQDRIINTTAAFNAKGAA